MAEQRLPELSPAGAGVMSPCTWLLGVIVGGSKNAPNQTIIMDV